MFILADKIKELRKKKDDLIEQLKAVNKELSEAKKQLVDLMIAEEVGNFKRDGKTFILTIKRYFAAIPETKEILYEQLREKGYGDLFTINTNTLSAFLKEQAKDEDGNCGPLPVWLDGLVRLHEENGITVRGR
jgi:hypothetical protein